jgi:hypothetical protein
MLLPNAPRSLAAGSCARHAGDTPAVSVVGARAGVNGSVPVRAVKGLRTNPRLRFAIRKAGA